MRINREAAGAVRLNLAGVPGFHQSTLQISKLQLDFRLFVRRHDDSRQKPHDCAINLESSIELTAPAMRRVGSQSYLEKRQARIQIGEKEIDPDPIRPFHEPHVFLVMMFVHAFLLGEHSMSIDGERT
jgi:hypothetical protein